MKIILVSYVTLCTYLVCLNICTKLFRLIPVPRRKQKEPFHSILESTKFGVVTTFPIIPTHKPLSFEKVP